MNGNRLNDILMYLDATNGEIAALANFDRTNVSRLRSGSRKISPQSITALKLATAIYSFAKEHSLLEKLCDYLAADFRLPEIDIINSIKSLLFQDIPLSFSEKAEARSAYNEIVSVFGYRLDKVMTLSDISNISLSRLMHIDASLISRFRNGLRMPGSRSVTAENLADIIYKRILKQGRQNALADIMHISAKALNEESFFAWLFNNNDLINADVKET